MKPFFSLSMLLLLQFSLLPLPIFAQKKQTTIPLEVDSFIQLSRAYTAEAEFDLAFTNSAMAGDLALKCCGASSTAYASYCFNEGRIRYYMGRSEEAIPWYEQSKDLRAQLLGTADVDYGKSLNNLAIAYENIGKYGLAEPLYIQALSIRKATAGRESATYANALANLAGLYLELGNYEKAEPMALEAKAIREKVLGKKHPQYAVSLISLANLYYVTNNFPKARDFYEAAKQVIEAQDDIDYYSYMNILDNLGAIYYQYDQLDQAKLYYEQAALLREEILGRDSPDYASSLDHLGVLYEYMGQPDTAIILLTEALNIMEGLGLQQEISYTYYAQDLSDVYAANGNISKSRDLQLQALKVFSENESLNKTHPRHLKGLRKLAAYEHLLGNAAAAIQSARELALWEEKPLASAIRHLSGDELANYKQDFEKNLYLYFTLGQFYPVLADLCYDKIMVYKGFLQNTALQLQQLTQTDTNLQQQYQQWRSIHRQLAAKYSSSTINQEELTNLETTAYQLEKELVRNGAKLDVALQSVSWQMVRDQLNNDEAAIEFIHYDNSLLTANKQQYAALLLLPQTEAPVFIPLGDEASLDSLLYQEDIKENKTFLNNLYSNEGKGKALYPLVWEPLVVALRNQPEIIKLHYAASGILHRINLTAIPDTRGRSMGQNYQLVMLGSTRQLALPASNHTKPSEPIALLYGGIEYSRYDEKMNETNFSSANTTHQLPTTTSYHNQRGYNNEDKQWQPLTWTEVEIMTAGDLLTEAQYQPQLRMGQEATESSLKIAANSGQSPYLIHLATHGFFFPDPTEDQQEGELAFRTSEHAMIRSGLILADGNYAWVNGQPREKGMEDGILTAYEVSQMNLQQTELVILSACETGLGDIRGTEGVYGLQRAFKTAGVRYLIMTLWQVPDFETQAFMTTFYLAWLEEGKSIPEAFHLAQAYMKARYGDAFQWAGFVLVE